MYTPIRKTIMTFIKYLVWTGVAAILQAALVALTTLDLPLWIIPLIASVLKAAATYVASKAEEYKP